MPRLGPHNRSLEFAVVDATATTVERLQEEMEIARPLITLENFADFSSGNLVSGSFSVKPRNPEECALSLQALNVACLRASNPNDPLFVEHAARKHPKTYKDVLLDFVDLTGGGAVKQ